MAAEAATSLGARANGEVHLLRRRRHRDRRQLQHEGAGGVLSCLLFGPIGQRDGTGSSVHGDHHNAGDPPAAQPRSRHLEQLQMWNHGVAPPGEGKLSVD
ncbi:MAG: hypothetical protein WDN31_01495 [Hyphomicrobium sp.]